MNESRNLLQKHFDTAFDTPDGIKKLRELILTLAMQGKLVPQDPNDQPASELLKEIAAEKARLIKAGKLKPQKPLSPIKPEEIPYQIPANWQWVRLKDICRDWGQKTPESEFTYIDVGSIDNSTGKISEVTQKISATDAPSRARKIVKKGTVIYSTVRPYLLNIAIVEKDYDPEPIASTAFAILSPLNGLLNSYVYNYLKSPAFIRYVENAMKGVAYPAINDGDFFRGLLPLAPIAEQKRIVARIEQLMGRCDELERLRAERDRMRLDTHAAAINQLLSASDSENFSSAWRFITSNFAELYSVKENVAELRKTILQLAVMGKLVPQDPNDQPASELLKEIAAEKARLIKSGKLKPNDHDLPINLQDAPFSIPSTWQLVRLNDLVSKIGSGSTPRGGKSVYLSNGIPFLRSQNIWNEGIKMDDVVCISETTHKKMHNTSVIAKDILLNITGASLGRCALVSDTFMEANVSQHVTIIRFIEPEIRQFMHCLFLSPCCQRMIWQRQVGMAREGLSKKVLEQFEIPIPSLAEQKRIVARVDQLMSLCDNLEQSIAAAGEGRAALLNAMMAKV